MKERSIILAGWEVRAILDGTKSTFRRLVTVPWKGSRRAYPYDPYWVDADGVLQCCDEYGDYHNAIGVLGRPYGDVGDRLWVREAYASNVPGCEPQRGYSYRADHRDPRGDGPANPMRWRSSVEMPRCASRITLDVTAVRIERLHAITEDGAKAEGIIEFNLGKHGSVFGVQGVMALDVGGTAVEAFAALWDDTNAKRGAPWSANPWTWIVEFQRGEP